MIRIRVMNHRTGMRLSELVIEGVTPEQARESYVKLPCYNKILHEVMAVSRYLKITDTFEQMMQDTCDFISTGKSYDQKIITHRNDTEIRIVLTTQY